MVRDFQVNLIMTQSLFWGVVSNQMEHHHWHCRLELRKAVRLYNAGYAERSILAIGVGDHAPAGESVAAKNYAVDKWGIDPNVFLLEEESTSTEENAEFAKKVFPTGELVLVVSDSYHILRSENCSVDTSQMSMG